MRVNKKLTPTAGAPVNVLTGQTAAQHAAAGLDLAAITHRHARRVFAQMLPATQGGLGYVLDGVPIGTTPSASNDAHVTAVLAAATANAPGGTYADSDPGAGIDLAQMWVDVAHTGDEVKISYDLKV